MYKIIDPDNIKYQSGVNYLKTTGVTRKIDELGRIVIPKEIRKNLSIRDGESLEILTDEDTILLKKHSQIKRFADLGSKLTEEINKVFDVSISITDREKILASNNTDIIDKKLNNYFINLIDNRESFTGRIEQDYFKGNYSIVPVISESDSIGLIIIENKSNENFLKLAKFIATIFVDKIDI